MGAFVPSGYLTFVKVLEVLGGVLVAIPRTRGMGLLILGPIIVNIFAFHAFIMEGAGMIEPMLLAVGLLALVCLWAERRSFLALAFKAGAAN
jgi:putative oxidoreductase